MCHSPLHKFANTGKIEEMWPRKKPKAPAPKKAVKRLVTGLIIGGAIGSVVGKHLLEKHDNEPDEDDAEETDN